MIFGRLSMQSMRVSIDFRIGIILVNQIYELEPCLAKSLEIATQSGPEFSLKNCQFKMTDL